MTPGMTNRPIDYEHSGTPPNIIDKFHKTALCDSEKACHSHLILRVTGLLVAELRVLVAEHVYRPTCRRPTPCRTRESAERITPPLTFCTSWTPLGKQ